MTSQSEKKVNAKWLNRLLAGDHQAFSEFVEKYKEMVFLCCRTLGLKEDEAEDMASEIFLAAYEGLGKFRGQAELSTWLWKIAYHKTISHLRKNNRQEDLVGSLDDYPVFDKSNQVINTMEGKEQAELIWDGVKKLPKLWAMSIVLFYREEKSMNEIAEIMKIRENTIKTYLFRGRKMLKELLASCGENIDANS